MYVCGIRSLQNISGFCYPWAMGADLVFWGFVPWSKLGGFYIFLIFARERGIRHQKMALLVALLSSVGFREFSL
uniref:Uncharacterized protein n=1 Tax=Arundo donax TaxID=35708 RepID=A0A0A9ARQ0_ARUDO